MAEIVLNPMQMGLGRNPLPPGQPKLKAFTGIEIPKSQWFSSSVMVPYVPRGKCQFNQPSCNSYASGKTYQTKYAITVDKPGYVRELSYSALHQEVTGGNMDEGSLPTDTIKINVAKGFFPSSASLPEWYSSPRQMPADAVANRHLYRGDEWEELSKGAEVVSAVLAMQPCDMGFWWYDTDVNPGKDGFLKVRGNQRLGGHALLACGVMLNFPNSPSGVGIIFNNHHGDSKTPSQSDERGNTIRAGIWGNDGFGVVPIERLDAELPSFGGYCLRSVQVEDKDLS